MRKKSEVTYNIINRNYITKLYSKDFEIIVINRIYYLLLASGYKIKQF